MVDDKAFEAAVTSGGAQSQDWTELRDAYEAARGFFAQQLEKQNACPAMTKFSLRDDR